MLGADRLGRLEALIGERRWHTRMSTTATSGRDVRIAASRVGPSPACPTTSSPASTTRRAIPSRIAGAVIRKDETERHLRPPGLLSAAPDSSSLGMNPRMPLLASRGPYALASRLDVSTINGGGPSTASSRATSNPSTSGSPMSSSITSGRRARAAARPEVPSADSPTTSNPSADKHSPRLDAEAGVVVDDEDRVHGGIVARRRRSTNRVIPDDDEAPRVARSAQDRVKTDQRIERAPTARPASRSPPRSPWHPAAARRSPGAARRTARGRGP